MIALTILAVAVSTAWAQGAAPGTVMKDCAVCPEMVVVPAGSFVMGSDEAETAREAVPADYARRELPRHAVTIAAPFALARYEVSRGEFARFVAATEYRPPAGCAVWRIPGMTFADNPAKWWGDPGFPQTDADPVSCVSFDDALAYAKWISDLSGQIYRLPSEAEWEYAARAGTATARHWGDGRDAACAQASVLDAAAAAQLGAAPGVENAFPCADDGFVFTAPVGSFPPNAFGLYDMLGNVSEWVMDCYNATYAGAPVDGSAWLAGNCDQRLTRGGAWSGKPWIVRAAERGRANAAGRNSPLGFRLARDIN
ncbi:MAG: formylglycine-generating enzyme family protein [Rhodospirillaceae bacterium]|nr:formylglycine-generating enzyme family protein [Rhodospirillaceae bacterium]